MRADEILEENGIDFGLIEQDTPTTGCEEAAEARGLETSQIVKSLIVETNGNYVHVCVPGDRTLSEKKFGEHRLVEPEKSKEITGLESGTVHPLASDLPHVIDERIFEKETVSFTVGTKTEGIVIDPENFRKALVKQNIDYRIKDVVVTTEEDIQQLVDEGADEEIASFLCENSYRKEFLKLSEDIGADSAADVIEELHREDVDFTVEDAREIAEASENQTHLQRLVKQYADMGEIDFEQEDFDLEKVVKQVLDENPDAVEDYRSGNESAINYLLGQAMKLTNGRADGGKVRKRLEEKL